MLLTSTGHALKRLELNSPFIEESEIRGLLEADDSTNNAERFFRLQSFWLHHGGEAGRRPRNTAWIFPGESEDIQYILRGSYKGSSDAEISARRRSLAQEPTMSSNPRYNEPQGVETLAIFRTHDPRAAQDYALGRISVYHADLAVSNETSITIDYAREAPRLGLAVYASALAHGERLQ